MNSLSFPPSALSPVSLFKLVGTIVVGVVLSGSAWADGPAAPPKPQSAISSDKALERLLKGNSRYVEGVAKARDFIAERPALVAGQNPYAAILSCADSRIAPEYAFDTGRGDLFVCRVAGNFANTESIASLEYGVAVLNIPLILVLGHESCGAVSSTVQAVREGTKFPGHIPSLIKALRPAVEMVLKKPGNVTEQATKENVRLTVEKLKSSGPILSEAVKQGKLKIVGGIYNLETGRVELL